MLIKTALRFSAFSSLVPVADNAHLVEHSEPVGEAPMFHQLAISDTEDVDPHHCDLLPRGSDASECALVGATIADASHHLVPVSHEVLHGRLHVREGVEVLTEESVYHR